MFDDKNAFEMWFANWQNATAEQPDLEVMRAANPVLIARNHRIEQAIQASYSGDFTPFHRLVDALAQPFAEREEFADLEAAPLPEEIVHQTFCGT
jgi:uncharacterized protein YdiU (UPF0061 family)